MTVERGDIYYITNDNPVGHEQCNFRPGIIVSNEACNMFSPVVEIVYLSTSNAGKHMPTHIKIDSATMPSVAKCEHIYSIDKSRLKGKIGTCTRDEIRQVNLALMISLGIGW